MAAASMVADRGSVSSASSRVRMGSKLASAAAGSSITATLFMSSSLLPTRKFVKTADVNC